MHEKEIEFCEKIKNALAGSMGETDAIDLGYEQAIDCLKSTVIKLKDTDSAKILEKEISTLTGMLNEKKSHGEKVKKAMFLVDEVKTCLEG